MNSSDSLIELDQLVVAMCDQTISDEGIARLNELLAGDRAARTSYLQQVWMDSELYSLSIDLDRGELGYVPAGVTGMHSSGDHNSGANSVADSAANQTHSSIGWVGWPVGHWLTIAATLLICCLGSGWVAYLGAHGIGPLALFGREPSLSASSVSPDAPSPEAMLRDPVARITGTRDCRWGGDEAGVGFGAPLRIGQVLHLEEGLAEVTFINGARIVLEGPAAYLVPGGNDARLINGRMSAAIPRTAVGFTVHTNRLAINSTNSQFGLVAYAGGDSEVHVFKGPIHAQVIDTRGRKISSLRLSATEAARLKPVSTSLVRFIADGDGFVRTLVPSIGPAEGLLAFEEFDYPVGQLAWHNGGFGWAGAWANLDSASGAHEPPTNAVANGSLVVGELVAQGNHAIQTGQFNRIRRVLSTSLRGVFDAAGLVENQDGSRLIGQDGGSVYVSFLQRASEVDDVFYGFELHRSDGNRNRVLCIGLGAEATGYGVSSNYNGVETGGLIDPVFAPLGEEDTATHLFVVRIDFGEDNHDVATIYRDPDSQASERGLKPTATLEGNFAFDRISMGNFDGIKGKTHEVDEIRIGTSFAAVTGQRPPMYSRLAPLAALDSVNNNLTIFLAHLLP